MITTKNISPDLIIIGTSMVTVVSIILALLLNTPVPLIIPVALVGLMTLTAHFKGLYFLLMSLLVLSVDLEFGGVGLDFPSEPLMLVFMFSGFVYFIAHHKRIDKSFYNHPLFMLLATHVIWIGITALFSSYISLSFKFFLAKLWYVVAFVVMGGYFIKNTEDFKQVFWAILLPMILVIVWVLLNFRSYGFDFEFVNKTMNPIYVNHVDYGVALAVFFPFCVFISTWYKLGSLARFVIHIGMVLILVGILFSYTRAAYISILIIPFAYLLFKLKLTKVAVPVALITAMLAIFYLANDNKYIEYAPDFDSTIFHTDFADHLGATVQLKDLSTMERVYRWVAGARMWQEHPYLGFGPSTFTSHYRSYASTLFVTYVSDNEENSTTHNYFLMTLIEQGVPGLVIFLSLCIALFIYGETVYHRLKKDRDKQLVMAVLISALLIMANIMMADLIETDEIGTMFFLYIAIIINFDLKSRKELIESNETN